MDTRTAVDLFLSSLSEHDPGKALREVADDVAVAIYPLGVLGTGKDLIEKVIRDLLVAFPDLIVSTKNIVVTGDSATAEVKLEGTQAADFAGIVNQDKHIDIDGAWHITVVGEQISEIEGYWCQQQVYRRLGVKRFDQVALV